MRIFIHARGKFMHEKCIIIIIWKYFVFLQFHAYAYSENSENESESWRGKRGRDFQVLCLPFLTFGLGGLLQLAGYREIKANTSFNLIALLFSKETRFFMRRKEENLTSARCSNNTKVPGKSSRISKLQSK